MSERTEEERERAREERARQRAGRSAPRGDSSKEPPAGQSPTPGEDAVRLQEDAAERLEHPEPIAPVPDTAPTEPMAPVPSAAPTEEPHAGEAPEHAPEATGARDDDAGPEPPATSPIQGPSAFIAEPPPIPLGVAEPDPTPAAEIPPIPIAPPDIQAPAAPSPRASNEGVAPPGEPPGRFSARTGRRSFPARAGALLALAAAIGAVWLLVHTLFESKHAKTVAPVAVVKVLIPEGKTRIQIAQIAAADGLSGSYRVASKRSRLLHPVRYGAPRGTPDLEGFLFPATYDVDSGVPVVQLVDEQLIAFRQNFGTGEFRRARALHITPYQLLTVASMIEREAQTNHDRPLIAAVIYNRLRQGIPLGIDATIYYAVELQKGIATYTHELTTAQLQIESAYNTRTHKGLPPTPISNPGLASIEAAAHPAHVPFLYYVAAADGCGEQKFSTTYEQFERNVAAYQAAVKQNGGRPPVCKRK
jgi:cell division protein YceG involved in septum cleavage